MKPDWRRGPTDIENHLYPRLVHLPEYVVEPSERKLSF